MHRTKFIHKSWQITRHRLRSIKQRYKYQPQVHNTTNKMYIHSEAINTQMHTGNGTAKTFANNNAFSLGRKTPHANSYSMKWHGWCFQWWSLFKTLAFRLSYWSLSGGSPYPRMDGKKIANLLEEGYRMPKPQHVDDQL